MLDVPTDSQPADVFAKGKLWLLYVPFIKKWNTLYFVLSPGRKV